LRGFATLSVEFSSSSCVFGHPPVLTSTSVGTPVTDASGIAHFVVVGDAVQPQPVFYETWLSDGTTVPHVYSNQVSIQYTSDAP
jgi:hypothetical protein